jgi:CarD family transcriptional regulator
VAVSLVRARGSGKLETLDPSAIPASCRLRPIRGEMVNLGVGDVVVYGAHGVGSVEARGTRSLDGEQQTVVVIAFAGGLSVQLPLTLAQAQLRAVVDAQGIAAIQAVLRAPLPLSKDPWLKRRRDSKAKMRDPIGLAEIIRDGNARETALARRPGSQLSPGERELLRRARELLANEIALARGIAVEEAGAWLDTQLTG